MSDKQKIAVQVYVELELHLQTELTPGRPETPPTYSHGGLPAEDPQIEVKALVRVCVHDETLDLDAETRNKLIQAILEKPDLVRQIDEQVLLEADD